MVSNTYSKEDCISALKQAEEELGHEPSQPDYRNLDISPSYQTIADRFGRWNLAKKKAGMGANRPSDLKYQDGPPKILAYSDEEWESLSKNMRFRRRQQAKIARMKMIEGCQECGYDGHPAALSFHHLNPDDKERDVSTMITQGYSTDSILEEVEKCEVLCRCCHSIEENDDVYSI